MLQKNLKSCESGEGLAAADCSLLKNVFAYSTQQNTLLSGCFPFLLSCFAMFKIKKTYNCSKLLILGYCHKYPVTESRTNDISLNSINRHCSLSEKGKENNRKSNHETICPNHKYNKYRKSANFLEASS